MKSPAQTHEELVKFGLDVYEETFKGLLKFLTPDKRVPGTAKMSEPAEYLMYEMWTPEQWQTIARSDPQRAEQMVRRYQELHGKYGGNGVAPLG